jgi:hypothetical protein
MQSTRVISGGKNIIIDCGNDRAFVQRVDGRGRLIAIAIEEDNCVPLGAAKDTTGVVSFVGRQVDGALAWKMWN